MKNKILYNYNIYVTTIIEKDKNYSFIYRGESYLLQVYDRPIEELNDINSLNQEILNHGYPCHIIMRTQFNELHINHNNKNYVLLKVATKRNREIVLDDIISFNYQPTHTKLNKSNWSNLWQNKIDYFEYQFEQMNEKYNLIKESINYYIGLWENAISYLNNPHIDYSQLVICHRRIRYNDDLISFYNPLNFVIDYKERDIGDYLKSYFFDRDKTIPINLSLSKTDPVLLLSRLLFPSYYFDLYEKIIKEEKEESSLKDIITKSKDYEIFLKNIFMLYRKKEVIPIEWIIKK